MRARSMALVAILGTSLLAAGASGQATGEGTSADAQAIRTLFKQLDGAFNKGDVTAMMVGLADDYQELDWDDPHIVLNRAAVVKQWAANAASNPPTIVRSVEVVLVKWLDPRTAVVQGTWMSKSELDIYKGTWMAVVVKKDGVWKEVSELAK